MSSSDQQAQSQDPQPTQPVHVFYCKVCTFPVEYCEFGSSLTRCKEWLSEDNPTMFDKFYSDEALQTKIGTLSPGAQGELGRDTAKEGAKAEAKAETTQKKKMASQVLIERIERNKRKHVTAILGLEAFDNAIWSSQSFVFGLTGDGRADAWDSFLQVFKAQGWKYICDRLLGMYTLFESRLRCTRSPINHADCVLGPPHADVDSTMSA